MINTKLTGSHSRRYVDVGVFYFILLITSHNNTIVFYHTPYIQIPLHCLYITLFVHFWITSKCTNAKILQTHNTWIRPLHGQHKEEMHFCWRKSTHAITFHLNETNTWVHTLSMCIDQPINNNEQPHIIEQHGWCTRPYWPTTTPKALHQ
jgi:hypothetical protein